MGKYFVSLWMVHVAKLLGKSSRSKELYAISTVSGRDDEGQQFVIMPDGNDICHSASLIEERRHALGWAGQDGMDFELFVDTILYRIAHVGAKKKGSQSRTVTP